MTQNLYSLGYLANKVCQQRVCGRNRADHAAAQPLKVGATHRKAEAKRGECQRSVARRRARCRSRVQNATTSVRDQEARSRVEPL